MALERGGEVPHQHTVPTSKPCQPRNLDFGHYLTHLNKFEDPNIQFSSLWIYLNHLCKCRYLRCTLLKKHWPVVKKDQNKSFQVIMTLEEKHTFCRMAQKAGKTAAAFDAIRKTDCQMCPTFRFNHIIQ